MNRVKTYQHGFIGGGKMAQIILAGLLKNRRVRPAEVLLSRRDRSQLRKIHRQFKVATTWKNPEVAENCRIVWLGIKPFQAREVLEEIAPRLRPGAVIVSMMAGISTAMIKKHVSGKFPVLRIMPNTPAQLGCGVTGIYFTKGFPAKLRKNLMAILQDLGTVVILNSEKQFDAVTGLSGSGPAFIYAMAKGFVAGGMGAGLSGEQARALAVQTLLGAATMLKESKQNFDALIAQVVSKGGTTEAGLKVLKKFRVESGIEGAVRAAARRSREIGRK